MPAVGRPPHPPHLGGAGTGPGTEAAPLLGPISLGPLPHPVNGLEETGGATMTLRPAVLLRIGRLHCHLRVTKVTGPMTPVGPTPVPPTISPQNPDLVLLAAPPLGHPGVAAEGVARVRSRRPAGTVPLGPRPSCPPFPEMLSPTHKSVDSLILLLPTPQAEPPLRAIPQPCPRRALTPKNAVSPGMTRPLR